MQYTEAEIRHHVECCDCMQQCELELDYIEGSCDDFSPEFVSEMQGILYTKIQAYIDAMTPQDYIFICTTTSKETRLNDVVEISQNGDKYFEVVMRKGDRREWFLISRFFLASEHTYRPAELPLTDGAGI